MIRRKTLFFLNLFAISITLALMVLPHHHHEGGDVCIINAACHDDHSQDTDDAAQGESNHHKHCDKDHIYLLEKGLVVRSNSIIHLLKNPEFSGKLKVLDLYLSSAKSSGIVNYIPPIYARGLFGPESNPTSRYVNLSMGLRAPPMA